MDSSGQFAKPMVIGLHCAHQVQAQMSITASSIRMISTQPIASISFTCTFG